jgi:hypothetical protein
MQTGKISPIFRFFMGTKKLDNSNRDSSSQQNFQDSPQQEPTEEEFLRAIEILNDSEEFKKNGLRCSLFSEGGKRSIAVKNAVGVQIRIIPGTEIYRTISTVHASERDRHGRILDRRI